MFSPDKWLTNPSTGFYPYSIDQSLRLDGSTAYLTKSDFGTATNTAKRTFSTWIKRATDTAPAAYNHIIGAGSSAIDGFGFGNTTEKPQWLQGGSDIKDGVRKLRDTTGWYHLFTTWNSTDNEIFIYVNGELDKSYTSSISALSKLGNTGHTTYIGRRSNVTTTFIHGYLAETVFLDGTIGNVSDFGETKDGMWVGKNISAAGLTFGDNGFYLDYADSSDLGKDVSGKGNHFTSNNITADDQAPDSPTNNFATFNPLDISGTTLTYSEGNLKAERTSSSFAQAYSSFSFDSGKWYAEFLLDTGNSGVGVIAGTTNPSSNRYMGQDSYTYGYYSDGRKVNNASYTSYGDSYTTAADGSGDVVGVYIDADNGNIYFSKNGTVQNSGTAAFTGVTGPFRFAIASESNCFHIANFGQDDSFAGLKTSGSAAASDENGNGVFYDAIALSDYLAPCTANLPDPVIGPGQATQADDHFDSTLYTGNGGTQSFVNAGSFQPDFVWQKNRSSAANHILLDSVRGGSKYLISNLTSADLNAPNYMTFNSDGATFSSTDIATNQSGQSYVAWNWKAGGAPSGDNSAANNAEPTAGSAKIDGSNQSGAFSGSPSIAIKRLSASTTAGFSIVQWTGTGSAGTIPHGLGAAPHFYVVKNLTDDSTSWQAYHRGIASDAETDYIYLNSNAAAGDADDWNDTAPTANVFSVKTHNQVNASGDEYVAYLFTSIEGFSKHASYVGNGSTDGTFVYTGFRPAFLLIGKTAVGGGWNWQLRDSVRGQFNPDDNELRANSNAAESSSSAETIDFLSNGFKPRSANGSTNENSYTYIYLAFAEAPFKYANAR